MTQWHPVDRKRCSLWKWIENRLSVSSASSFTFAAHRPAWARPKYESMNSDGMCICANLADERRRGSSERAPSKASKSDAISTELQSVGLKSSSDMTMFIFIRYPGGKFRCYQRLLNLIPPHQDYIETHLVGGAELRHKAPA